MSTPTEEESPQAEIIINRSSSRDGGVGCSIRLIRYKDEDEADYYDRILDAYRWFEREFLGKTAE